MREVGIDIQADPVKCHPSPQPHADGGDLALVSAARRHPNADAAAATLAHHVEACQGADKPLLEVADIGTRIGLSLLEIEHDVAHALAWAVIGVLTAAPGFEDREARIDEIRVLGAASGGVERRMLQQPDLLASLTQ